MDSVSILNALSSAHAARRTRTLGQTLAAVGLGLYLAGWTLLALAKRELAPWGGK